MVFGVGILGGKKMDKTITTILSYDAGLYVIDALRKRIDHIEDQIKTGEKLFADKSLTEETREYFKKREIIEKKCCEEIKALIKEVRYERI